MAELNVSNIQHFSTGDGPGIRTTVFLKGCNLKCPWCHNPETVSKMPQEVYFKNADRKIVYGKIMNTDEVIADVMEDLEFYLASGGGVTVSGGEPLLQSEALYELLAGLKRRGISTLVDTAGAVPWQFIELVRGVTDIFYYDIKSGDGEKYFSVTGANPDTVYGNLDRLISENATVRVRIPLIPDFNTSDGETEKIIKRLSGKVGEVDLLPFHRLGSAKYEALGKNYLYKDVVPMPLCEVEKIARLYENHFKVNIEN